MYEGVGRFRVQTSVPECPCGAEPFVLVKQQRWSASVRASILESSDAVLARDPPSPNTYR